MDEEMSKKITPIYNRLLKICKRRKWTMQRLAAELEQPKETFHHWKFKEPKTLETLRKIEILEGE